MFILYFFFHKRGDVISCIVMACPSMPWGAENKRGVHLVSLYFRAATTKQVVLRPFSTDKNFDKAMRLLW